jgi:hypothetical protein
MGGAIFDIARNSMLLWAISLRTICTVVLLLPPLLPPLRLHRALRRAHQLRDLHNFAANTQIENQKIENL